MLRTVYMTDRKEYIQKLQRNIIRGRDKGNLQLNTEKMNRGRKRKKVGKVIMRQMIEGGRYVRYALSAHPASPGLVPLPSHGTPDTICMEMCLLLLFREKTKP